MMVILIPVDFGCDSFPVKYPIERKFGVKNMSIDTAVKAGIMEGIANDRR
ncbi:MAG: hypothetical protein ACK5JD_06830 [Mangrovibacterium sp.]